MEQIGQQKLREQIEQTIHIEKTQTKQNEFLLKNRTNGTNTTNRTIKLNMTNG